MYASAMSQEKGDWEMAITVFSHMLEHGCPPDEDSFNAVLWALAKAGRVKEATNLHDTMVTRGLTGNEVS